MGQVASIVDDFKTIVENDKEIARRKKIADVRKRQNSQAYTFASTDTQVKKAG